MRALRRFQAGWLAIGLACLCLASCSAPIQKPVVSLLPTATPTQPVFMPAVLMPTETTCPPTPSPALNTPEPLPLAGKIIGLDPGHQRRANCQQEPVAPGSSATKNKVSGGTKGKWTGMPEYEVNLAVGLLLRDLLVEQGAVVVMTRESNDVNISNAERAQQLNEAQTDYALRLHCNGLADEQAHGAFVLIPKENPFVEDCNHAATLLIDSFCAATQANNRGITVRSDQTGFNWCQRMIICVEMGHMTNKQEDALLSDPDYQHKMAQGLLDGILRYFAEYPS